MKNGIRTRLRTDLLNLIYIPITLCKKTNARLD